MSYGQLQQYACPQCGDRFMWSLYEDPSGYGEPYCDRCFCNFININDTIGKLVCED